MSSYTTETLDYNVNDKTFEAFIAKPDGSGVRPVVFICHAWAGRDDFANSIACRMAELGYIGVALDVYGKGILGDTVDEKMALMQPLLDTRAELQLRLKTGVEQVQALDFVDSNNLAAVGFCFGGLCVLDMARVGLNLKAVVSVHGLFGKPNNLSNYKISSKVLALHGHLDPMVTPVDVDSFMQELDGAEADWQINTYGKALHAFTNPEANDHNLGTVYNSDVAQRAWFAIDNFLAKSLR